MAGRFEFSPGQIVFLKSDPELSRIRKRFGEGEIAADKRDRLITEIEGLRAYFRVELRNAASR